METNPAIVDASLVEPLIEIVMTNVAALLPIGITLMGVFIGIRLIPKIVHMFM